MFSSSRQPISKNQRFLLLTVLLLAVLALAACGGAVAPGIDAAPPAPTAAPAQEATPVPAPVSSGDMPANPADRDGMYSAPPAMTIDPAKFYYATLTTDKGCLLYTSPSPRD